VTHAMRKTIAAFLNTEGGDLLIGAADNGSVVGIEQLESDDKFIASLTISSAMVRPAASCW
jgi:predicted HTH transcriptional regulator